LYTVHPQLKVSGLTNWILGMDFFTTRLKICGKCAHCEKILNISLSIFIKFADNIVYQNDNFFTY